MVVLMNVGEFAWRRLDAKVSFNHQICLTKRDSVVVTGGGMGRMKGFARAVGEWGVAPGADLPTLWTRATAAWHHPMRETRVSGPQKHLVKAHLCGAKRKLARPNKQRAGGQDFV